MENRETMHDCIFHLPWNNMNTLRNSQPYMMCMIKSYCIVILSMFGFAVLHFYRFCYPLDLIRSFLIILSPVDCRRTCYGCRRPYVWIHYLLIILYLCTTLHRPHENMERCIPSTNVCSTMQRQLKQSGWDCQRSCHHTLSCISPVI